MDPGFRHEGVLLVQIDATRAGYDGTRLRAFYQQVLTIAERLPGVTAASLSSITPLMGGGISLPIAVNGQPITSGELHCNLVAPRYFETLSTSILGRDPRPTMRRRREWRLSTKHSLAATPTAARSSSACRWSVRFENCRSSASSKMRYEGLRQTRRRRSMGYFQAAGPVRSRSTASVRLQAASAIRAEVQPKLAGKLVRIETLTSQLESSLVQERLMATWRAPSAGSR